MHRAPGQIAVGPSQVDVFEYAGLGSGGRKASGADAVGVDGQQLPGFDVAHEGRADDVECRGLGGDDPAAVEPTQRQRAHPVGITSGVERGLVHEDQAESAPNSRKQFQGGLLDTGVGGPASQQGAQDIGIGGRSAGHVVIDQADFPGPVGKLGGVDQISVVSQRNSGAGRSVAEHRLCVFPCCRAGGRVAAMADRDVTRHGTEGLLIEHLTDQTEVLEDQNLRPVGHRDPGRLLAPMLEGIETVIGEFGNFLARGPDAEYPAFFPGWVFQWAGHDMGCSLTGFWLARCRVYGHRRPKRESNRAVSGTSAVTQAEQRKPRRNLAGARAGEPQAPRRHCLIEGCQTGHQQQPRTRIGLHHIRRCSAGVFRT